ncbi:MAG: hypothetical protein JO352_01335 [Chloroflexi bacterium]|nr:hypothetical protein [Chloroflexota bacterium]MBV9595438.1 hypothetical protein [Chloroflexota bacterium]
MFRREMRREERRDVVEVAAVGEAVHAHNREREEQTEVVEAQQSQEGILSEDEFAAEKKKILGL